MVDKTQESASNGSQTRTAVPVRLACWWVMGFMSLVQEAKQAEEQHRPQHGTTSEARQLCTPHQHLSTLCPSLPAVALPNSSWQPGQARGCSWRPQASHPRDFHKSLWLPLTSPLRSLQSSSISSALSSSDTSPSSASSLIVAGSFFPWGRRQTMGEAVEGV